jgi:hypothetical protein
MDRLLDHGSSTPKSRVARKSWTPAKAAALTLREVLPNERARRLDTSNQRKI